MAGESIIGEILEIDFLLLAYKGELARAQPPIRGALVLNFVLVVNGEEDEGEDTEPVMARYFLKDDGTWMIRKFDSDPGELAPEASKREERSATGVRLSGQFNPLRDRLFDTSAQKVGLLVPSDTAERLWIGERSRKNKTSCDQQGR